ncbi:hypothetical protein PM082_023221 [Marasmius tenuissimus]|nr:hypothetical protein PM082_023221 [Marasmius tenuissimus]
MPLDDAEGHFKAIKDNKVNWSTLPVKFTIWTDSGIPALLRSGGPLRRASAVSKTELKKLNDYLRIEQMYSKA